MPVCVNMDEKADVICSARGYCTYWATSRQV